MGLPGAPDLVNSAAPMFDGVAHEVRTAVMKLSATLDGLGNFWGDDGQGAKFAAGHLPHAPTVQSAASSIAIGLGGIADALEAQAVDHRRADAVIAERLTVKPR